MRYGNKWPEYARQWDKMTLTPARRAEIMKAAQFALDHKKQYQDIEKVSGVPWILTAAIHRRESDADFKTYLGNGEPLNRRTRLVPRGRGPFTGPNAFVDGAIDAYKLDGLSGVRDWRLEKMLYYGELFNGTGYNNRGLPSPYVWGGSNQQRAGKYVADGKWSATAFDRQPGVGPLMWAMSELDPDAKKYFIRET